MEQKGLAAFGAKFAGAAAKFGNNKYIVAIVEGMMASMPIIIGASAFLILVAFPIDAWQTFLDNMGLSPLLWGIAGVTLDLIGLFTAMLVAYAFVKNEGEDGKTGAIFAMAVFFFVVPFGSMANGEVGIPRDYLGAQGLLIGMVVGLLIAKLYTTLIKIDKLTIKMPESVPPAVSLSLKPTFVALIIFAVVIFFERMAAFTSFGGIYMLIHDLIAAPFIGAAFTWPMFLTICILSCLLFFFGVHPNVIRGPFTSAMNVLNVSLMAAVAYAAQNNISVNLEFLNDFVYADQGISNAVLFSVLFAVHQVGGTGSTIGLAVSMLFAKSARYKTLGKIGFMPAVFNINEPLIFGVPIMLNPFLLLPMILAPAAGMLIVFLGYQMGAYNSFIPATLPWTLPHPIGAILLGGFPVLLVSLLMNISFILIWFPFFKLADRQNLKLEAEEEAKLATT